MARFIVFGHLTIDDTVLPDGRTAMGTAGGNALYAAIGARMWTDDLAIVTRLGQGYPITLLHELQQAGYRTDGLIPSSSHSIRQWQLYDCEGGRRYVPLASSGTYVDLTPRPDEIPTHTIKDAVACHVAPMPIDLQAQLVHWARDHGLRVIVDPHHECVSGTRREWMELLPYVDAFCPSREEAQSLLESWDGPDAAVRTFAEWGASVVCLKLGEEGAMVYRAADRASWRVPSLVTSPVDTTGCGDAFCGGFLVGWHDTHDLQGAISYGAVSASFVAADFGAQHALHVNHNEATQRLHTLLEVKA